MLTALKNLPKKHPKTLYVVYVLVVAVLLVELFLRISLRYQPGYYVAYAKPKPGIVLHYPYGIMKINHDGYPDDEFAAVKTRPRVAYVGDSNCYGVGAGYGYRVTELLEQQYPDLEHMNLSAGIGAKGITERDALAVERAVDRYDLDMVVYLLTLNDILPDATSQDAAPSRFQEKKLLRLRHYFDWLRGRSYLYTHVRTTLKNYYAGKGYDIGGQRSYELYPASYGDVFEATARRIDTLAAKLKARGVRFVVAILPYEMQVSREAEAAYLRHGVKWDDEFIDRGPQTLLLRLIQVPTVIDLYDAFAGGPQGRELCKLGECFVYNKGDKLDWHHPNRYGHRLIADFIVRREGVEPVFSTLDGSAARSSPQR